MEPYSTFQPPYGAWITESPADDYVNVGDATALEEHEIPHSPGPFDAGAILPGCVMRQRDS